MMLRTGNKRLLRSGKKALKGFTLLEVMITTAVLALGALLIYQSFFIAVDSFNYYSTILKITPWMDEKIWQAQNSLRRQGSGAGISTGGRIEVNSKDINWSLSYSSIDQSDSLYNVYLALSWLQGSRQVKLSRSAYAIYTKP